ncbi:DUF7504 family protein [Haladaptatus sp. DFWS20]|uniref:DUF7504 family protein n=1 Tax=Haladaptatus sp. DFWS20 TaxID=3403467 RepID=UPI003EC0434B
MRMERNGNNNPFICGVEAPLEIQYDQQRDHSLSAVIIQEMIEAAGVEPSDIPNPLYESVDPDALEELFQPLMDGTPRENYEVSFAFAGHYITIRDGGRIQIESELGRLKRTGGNILLTGNVPEDVLDQVSGQLLGEQSLNRTPVIAQYGKDAEVAQMRLSQVDSPLDHAHILTYRADARSATQLQASQPSQIAISYVTGTFEEFQVAIQDKISDLQNQQNGFDPAELRFCFDSLRLLIEETGIETTKEFISKTVKTVDSVNGLGHYIHSGTFDSDSVQAVKSKFDVVIELRANTNGLEQRLHLHGTNHTTQWFPI